MIFSPDIIMGWYYRRWFIVQRELFIQAPFQDIFDHGVIDPCAHQGTCASGFQPLRAILFLQHQHPKTGFIVLLDINAVFQHEGSCLKGSATNTVGLGQQVFFVPSLYLLHTLMVSGACDQPGLYTLYHGAFGYGVQCDYSHNTLPPPGCHTVLSLSYLHTGTAHCSRGSLHEAEHDSCAAR